MIINGDSLEVLKTLEDNSVDTVITDPPYGYSFMGKDWDKAVPSVEIWQECLRVLKPGAFACVMSAPRSDVQNAMISRLMEAGFRLDFTPIYWTYATGFPKAGNIGKLVDKRAGATREVLGKYRSPENTSGGKGRTFVHAGTPLDGLPDITAPATPQAKALDGSYAGFQPKPAVEVVIVAMKPLSEKTHVDQALKNGKGITWLDDCRVPTNEDMKSQTMPDLRDVGQQSKEKIGIDKLSFNQGITAKRLEYTPNTSGRFPANLLVSDDVLNDGRVIKSQGGKLNKDGAKTLFNNAEGWKAGKVFNMGDSGSYSRYFDLDAWARERLPAEQAMTFPFAIFPKASKSEKNKGLEHMEGRDYKKNTTASRNRKCQTCNHWEKSGSPCGCAIPSFGDWVYHQIHQAKNHHPTVKPLKLMAYLITLFSREGDTVLDPFVGSGTTVVAAEQLGRKGIGIEREAEYAEIARARVEHAKTEDDTNKQLQLIE